MATYVIGDVQGCANELKQLVDQLNFDPAADQLWFAGDLVNRGPASAETLRFIRSFGAQAITVLGNHDLHLLAVAAGGKGGRRDSLADVLTAPDRDELLHWLRQQPLLHESADGQTLLIHAGLPPQWDAIEARACAREVEGALRGSHHAELLKRMYGDQPDLWSPDLADWPRLRFIVNCFTRLRYCTAEGRIAAEPKVAPGLQPPGLLPWFAVPGRRTANTTVLFGHWSAIGRVHWPEYGVWGLDTGCIWGGSLTALHLERAGETGALHALACTAYQRPDAVSATAAD